MQTYSAEQTAARLAYPALADAIAEVLANDSAVSPERAMLDLSAGGKLLVMPAADEAIALTKLVTIHPDNARHDRPTLQGEMIVIDAATGDRLGMLHGATVSERRTAAVSLLAAQKLAPRPDASLLIVGAGRQARAHLDAFHEGLGVGEVFIASRSPQPAQALAAYARERGLEATVVDTPADALDKAKLIATTTTSTTPVLNEPLAADAFVAAVGAFHPAMAELAPALIEAATVVVDALAGARAEAGDLIQAEAVGRFDWDRALDFADVLQQPPAPGAPIVFKSVGCSLWDLAAARLAFAD